VLLYFALLLREWQYADHATHTSLASVRALMQSSAVKPEDLLILAKGHFELWERIGVFGEPYHIHRSKQLFDQFFKQNPNHDRVDDIVVYIKVLQHCGDYELAASVVKVLLANNEGDVEYPNLLFIAGTIFKALRQYETANNYFFEAAQVGPPRYFTKLEMMIIISRLIEELQGEEDADEDSYRMVHAHMILDVLLLFLSAVFITAP
jgi:tetratricopeptide (TPR) repeat protein